jgi:hypothetical protein
MTALPGSGPRGGTPWRAAVLMQPSNDNVDEIAPFIDLILAGRVASVPGATALADATPRAGRTGADEGG